MIRLDFQEAVEGRRSIRFFTDETVPEKDIRHMINTATMAPSAGNNQDWRFIAIRNNELKQKMKETLQEKLISLAKYAGKENPERYGHHHTSILFADAPLALVVLSKPYRSKMDEILRTCGYAEAEIDYLRMRPDLQTIGGAIQTILLTAYTMSYGSCWMVAPNVARHELEQLLEISPPWSIAAIVAIGRPAKEPQPKQVKPLDEVLDIID